jgi:hypothetical protein
LCCPLRNRLFNSLGSMVPTRGFEPDYFPNGAQNDF